MFNLFDLVSQTTRENLEKIFEGQSKILDDAIREAMMNFVKGDVFRDMIQAEINERADNILANHVEWYFEDIDIGGETFLPISSLIKAGIKHFMESDTAREKIGQTIKTWIEEMIQDQDDCLYEHFEDQLYEHAQKIYEQEMRELASKSNQELSSKARELIVGHIHETLDNVDDNEWEEAEKDW